MPKQISALARLLLIDWLWAYAAHAWPWPRVLAVSIVHYRHRTALASLVPVGSAPAAITFFLIALSLSVATGLAPAQTAATQHVVLMRTPDTDEPESSSSASVRYDIPGWDSIRRTSAGPEGRSAWDVSDAHAVAQLRDSRMRESQDLMIPMLFALLLPVLGWVGLDLALRAAHGEPMRAQPNHRRVS